MFSKELENLIQATLEDGILEDYEKAALVKRAQAEGVDLTELEIYINSLLQKRQRELNERKNSLYEKYEKEKKEAFGRTCPNCGKQMPPLTLKCECGYEFTKQAQTSSVHLLSEKIDKIIMAPMENRDPESDGFKEEKLERNKQVRDIITLFPVPNTKEDIVDFLALSAPNSKQKGGIWGTTKGRIKIAVPVSIIIFIIVLIICYVGMDKSGDGLGTGAMFGGMAAYGIFYVCVKRGTDIIEENKTAEVWRSKFNQVLMKGRSLRGDSDFQRQLDYYESMLNK